MKRGGPAAGGRWRLVHAGRPPPPDPRAVTIGSALGVVMLLRAARWRGRAKVLGAVTGTLALPLFGGLLATLAKTWNRFYGQQAGPFGWQTGAGPFISSILLTAAVVAVTLVGGRLLRYPLSQPAGPRPATPEARTPPGPPATPP